MPRTKNPKLESSITVLMVSPHEEDHHELRGILQDRCQFDRVGTREAMSSHLKRARTRLVICEQVLADGDWRDILADLHNQKEAPLLIVLSRHADERLWAEVLNLGGYDVLIKPFDHAEVSRVVNMATRRSSSAAG